VNKNGKIVISQEHFDKHKALYDDYKLQLADAYSEVAESFNNERASHGGDNIELSALTIARVNQNQIINRIRLLDKFFERVVVGKKIQGDKDVISLGSNVTIALSNKEIIDAEVVFNFISDPNNITIDSPMGKAILGKRVGSNIEFMVNEKEITGVILAVNGNKIEEETKSNKKR